MPSVCSFFRRLLGGGALALCSLFTLLHGVTQCAAASAAAAPPPPRLHYRPAAGWVGDVHPVFFRNAWYLYYLEVPREPFRDNLNDLRSALAVSTDLLHWEQRPITLNDPKPWWAIANVVHQGRLHALSNGPKGFYLATSTDGTSWSLEPHNPVVPYPADNGAGPGQRQYRDPSLYFDAAANLYRLIVACRDPNLPVGQQGAFFTATSHDLQQWSALTSLYFPGNINVPECPELFTLAGRFYLLGNWGITQVGQARWRWATTPTGPWHTPEFDAFDGSELMAPNSATDGQRRLLMGWVPTYRNRRDFADYQWAGDLVFPREIYTTSHGLLALRPPAELLNLRQSTAPIPPTALAPLRGTAAATAQTWTNAPGADYAAAWLPGTMQLGELEATFTPGPDCSAAGLVFQAGDPEFPGYAVQLDFAHRTLSLRQHLDPRRIITTTALPLAPGEPAHVRLFLDGELVEVFVNDQWSLAGRIHRATPNPRLGLFIAQGACAVSAIRRHALKPLFAPQPEKTIDLTPARGAVHGQHGQAVLFASATANVFTRFAPALNFTGPFSIECRCWITPGTGNRKANLIVKGDGERPGYHYGLNLTADNAFELYVRATHDFVAVASPPGTAPAPGQWAQVTGVVEPQAGRLTLYLNGQQLATTQLPPFTLDPANQGALRLGVAAGIPHANQFFGLLDDVRFWARALTPAEVAASAAGQPASTQGKILDWNFDSMQNELDGHTPRAFAPNLVSQFPALRAGLYDGARIYAADTP
jgi:beta-fructofuranosidase